LEVLAELRHVWNYFISLTFWYRIHLSLSKSFFFATLYATRWNVHEYSLQKTNKVVHFLCLSSPIFTLKWQEQSSERRWLHITWSQNAFPSLQQILSPR